MRFTYVAAERSSCELSECVQTGSLREWFIIDVNVCVMVFARRPKLSLNQNDMEKARVNRKYYTES